MVGKRPTPEVSSLACAGVGFNGGVLSSRENQAMGVATDLLDAHFESDQRPAPERQPAQPAHQRTTPSLRYDAGAHHGEVMVAFAYC